MLFAAVKAARFAGVDPEDALNAACEKFIRRYGAVEQGARDRGVSVSDLTLEEMTGLVERRQVRRPPSDPGF